MTTTLSNSFVSLRNSQTHLSSGSSLMQADQCLSPCNLFISTPHQGKTEPLKYRRPLTVRAGQDRRRPSGASIFVGGFVLGGIAVGTLGCIFAPQISKALTGEQRKDLMRKLPKFIYDEEKALEKTRKILTEKIAQLNTAIDEVSAQLHSNNDHSNGAAVTSEGIEASFEQK